MKRAAMLLLTLGACAAEPSEMLGVDSIRADGPTVVVELEAKALSEESLIDRAADRAGSVAEAILADGRYDGATDIQFNVSYPTMDNLGNEQKSPLMSFSMATDYIANANWSKLSGPRILGLTYGAEPASVYGAALMMKYCQHPDNRALSANFCG